MTYSTARYLLLGMRPPTLLLGISPVIVGFSLAVAYRQSFSGSWQPFVIALAFVIALQGAANLVNDVKDAATGVDNESRVGPLRVVQAGLVSATAARTFYRLLIALALVLASLLAYRSGPTIFWVGAFSAAAAYSYTGGPWPLSHAALGELVALIFFGPVAVLGSAFLVSGVWQWADLGWSLGPGLLAAAVMAINNVRDLATDRQTTKLTLPMLLPDSIATRLPALFLLASLGIYGLAIVRRQQWLLGSIGLAVLLGFVIWQLLPLYHPAAGRLNLALKKTSLFVVIYSLALAGLMLL